MSEDVREEYFGVIRYYLAAKIDFTGFPILAAPDL